MNTKSDGKDGSEELTHIEGLKRKLFYSHEKGESAVRERGLRQHHIDIGKNWEETDQKSSELEERKRLAEERERAGLATQNAFHHGSTQYGHFSASENLPEYAPQNAETKQAIDTSLAGNREAKKEPGTIGAFLSEKFADARATKTQKKMAVQDLSMRYTSARIEKSIYPDLKNQGDVRMAAEQAEAAKVEERYHPDMHVVSIGKKGVVSPVPPAGAVKSSGRGNGKSDDAERKSRFHFGVFFFILISVFFLASLGYAYYALQNGGNEISSDRIDIRVTGPISVRSGEISDFTVDVTNSNAGDLILSDLVIQYPDGTRSALDPSMSLPNDRIEIGTIRPGETVRRKASAIFFGEENVKKKIHYTYEFNIEDSATVFTAEKEVGVFIASSPVTAKIVNVTEITNNQDLSFDIEVISNSEEIVRDIQLRVEYPFGYSLTESNVKPIADNNTWDIGDIEPLGKKVIKLKGRLIGTSNIEKNFRFTLGVTDRTTKQMATVLSTQDQKILIRKPFVAAQLSLDGTAGVRIVQFEEQMKGDLSFTNNLDTPITDVVVEMTLNGAIIDRQTVKSNNGFYRSSDDVVFWDKAQDDRLALVNPGDTRELSFNMNVLKGDDELMRTLRRSTANLTVSIRAKRLNESRVPEEVISGTSVEIRLESRLSLESGLAYASGPFANTGPFPPQVNKETTYTYVGRITNTSNSIRSAVFSAKLPPNATWKGTYSSDIPASAVSYSTSRREITIALGDLPSGLGIDKPVREFAFKIGFTPTLTERGFTPNVILQPSLSGIDTFTNRLLSSGVDSLTVIPKLDPGNVGEGLVE